VRAVLDPGVLIAALISAVGAPRVLLALWLEGAFELIGSPQLLAELERVLLREKFRSYLTEPEVREFLDLLLRFATIVPDPPPLPGVTPDPKDDYLVALARSSGARVLVSGDRHLCDLADPQPPVLTPRAFLNRLQPSS
jgi:putative PIN family toxin of toxin-antitoxin system